MATIRIPTPLRRYTGDKAEVGVSGTTVREAIEDLERRCPGIKAQICDDQGRLRRFVNVFVGEEDIRFARDLDTPVREGDELTIVPAIAGGGAPAR